MYKKSFSVKYLFVFTVTFIVSFIVSSGTGQSAELKVPGAYKTIGEAMSKAVAGDTVRVAAGTYKENVIIKQKVVLAGAGIGKSVIDGGGKGSVVICEDGSVVQGFTIKNSGKAGMTGQVMDAGVKINRAYATVSQNLITGNNTGIVINQGQSSPVVNNRIVNNSRYGVYILYSKARIKNNVITGNKLKGVYSGYSQPEIINNVITGSDTLIFSEVSHVTIAQNILADADLGIQIAEFPGDQESVDPVVSYNLMWNNKTDYVNTIAGTGDIKCDPLFSDKKSYKLKKGSPAVDTGNPDKAFNDTDGTRNDIGAYGGPVAAVTSAGKSSKRKWGGKVSKWAIPKKKDSGPSGTGWESISTKGKDKMKRAEGNYMLYCSSCHGFKGDGEGDLADELEVPPRDHTDASIMSERTDENIFKTISLGGEAMEFDIGMPPHITVLPEKEIRELVQYIRKLCKCEYKGN